MPRAGATGKFDVTANVYRVSLGVDKNILKLDSGYVHTILWTLTTTVNFRQMNFILYELYLNRF